jgi:hypothetical protein
MLQSRRIPWLVLIEPIAILTSVTVSSKSGSKEKSMHFINSLRFHFHFKLLSFAFAAPTDELGNGRSLPQKVLNSPMVSNQAASRAALNKHRIV